MTALRVRLFAKKREARLSGLSFFYSKMNESAVKLKRDGGSRYESGWVLGGFTHKVQRNFTALSGLGMVGDDHKDERNQAPRPP
jgi:hypothetical protein